jgi:hypothetical protein
MKLPNDKPKVIELPAVISNQEEPHVPTEGSHEHLVVDQQEPKPKHDFTEEEIKCIEQAKEVLDAKMKQLLIDVNTHKISEKTFRYRMQKAMMKAEYQSGMHVVMWPGELTEDGLTTTMEFIHPDDFEPDNFEGF